MKKTSFFAFTTMCFLSITSCQSDNEIYKEENSLEQVNTTNKSKNINNNFHYKVDKIKEQIITDYENGIEIHNNSYFQNIQVSYNISDYLLNTEQARALKHEFSVIEDQGIQNYMSDKNYSQYFKDQINNFLNLEDITNIESSAEFNILSQNEKNRLSALVLLQKDFFEYQNEYQNTNNVSAKSPIPAELRAYLLSITIGTVAGNLLTTPPGGVPVQAFLAMIAYKTIIDSITAMAPWTIFFP